MYRLAFNVVRPCSHVIPCAARTTIFIASRHLSHGSQAPTSTGRPEGSPTPRSPIGTGPAPPPPDPADLDNLGIPPQNFSRPTLSALNFWYRFAKFSFIGLAIVTGGTLVGFEATHFWVENVELAAPSDPDGELARWSWINEAERWTGGERGGTDPAIGTKAAHALRSAWMAQHWGTGANIIGSNALATTQSENAAIEARLEYSHDFLTLALALANERQRDGKPIRPESMSEILARKAATLERIGSKGSLFDARALYEHVWDVQPELGTKPDDLARLALKLGDVNARLGDTDEACSWWTRSLQLASDNSGSQTTSDLITSSDTRLELPDRLPSSPYAQRTIAAVLSSLSASYAQRGLLSDAKAVQDTGIALLAPPSSPQESSEIPNRQATMDTNPNSGAVSPPHALHELYLQHRLSLLALHRAEVAYALRSSSASETLEELAQAAIEAEHVVRELSSSSTQPSHQAKLDQSYAKERTLSAPANSLLRDARRTALHAWTLSGILHEDAASSSSPSPPSSSNSNNDESSSTSKSLWKKVFSATLPSPTPSDSALGRGDAERRAALRCYMRALAWAGVPVDGSELEPEPSRDLLDSEWRALWAGYTRTRDAVLASARARVRDGDV